MASPAGTAGLVVVGILAGLVVGSVVGPVAVLVAVSVVVLVSPVGPAVLVGVLVSVVVGVLAGKLDATAIPFDGSSLVSLEVCVTWWTAPQAAAGSSRMGKRRRFFMKHTSSQRWVVSPATGEKVTFRVEAAVANFQVETGSRSYRRAVISLSKGVEKM